MIKIFTWSQYKFLHVALKWPEYGDNDTDRVSLRIGIYKLFIDIPLWKYVGPDEYSSECRKYGIAYHGDTFWLYTGKETKSLDAPWQREIIRMDLLKPNGSLFHRNTYKNDRKNGEHVHWYELEKSNDISNGLCEIVQLSHTLKDGTIQERTVTLKGEEREWRMKWFMWLPFQKFIKRECDFTFSEEIGERSGSWKGGLMATSTEWKHGESLTESFMRWYKSWDGR
jgi:hypothetical protein